MALVQSAILELSLQATPIPMGYQLALRYYPPDSSDETSLLPAKPIIKIDFNRLRNQQLNTETYGRSLGDMLTSWDTVQNALDKVFSIIQSKNVPLRLRLRFDSSAPELETIRWETLRLPPNYHLLATTERVLLSRCNESSDVRSTKPSTSSILSALVVISSPVDLARFRLPNIDRLEEGNRIRKSLGKITITELANEGQATLTGIGDCLIEGCTICYLACQGTCEQKSKKKILGL